MGHEVLAGFLGELRQCWPRPHVDRGRKPRETKFAFCQTAMRRITDNSPSVQILACVFSIFVDEQAGKSARVRIAQHLSYWDSIRLNWPPLKVEAGLVGEAAS